MNANTSWNTTTIATPVSVPADIADKVQFVHVGPKLPAQSPEPVAAPVEPQTSEAIHHATLDRSQLATALAIVKNVVERRNTIPILSNVKLQAAASGLAVSGTDMDIDISVTVPGAVDSGFAITAPMHQMSDILTKARKSEMVALADRNGTALELDTEHSVYDLQGLPVSDFPVLQTKTANFGIELDGEVFRDALESVAGAISKEETRYYLNGVYLHFYDGSPRMVATDGHRLYCRDFEASHQYGGPSGSGVIIPRKAVELFLKLTRSAKNMPDRVSVDWYDSKMVIRFDGVTITTKLIDGTFPDYNRVIPTCYDKSFSCIGSELAGAVADAALVASDRGRGACFGFDASGVTVTVCNPDAGSSIATAPGTIEGEAIDIGFNSRYIAEALKIVPGAVQFGLSDPGSPTLITSADLPGFRAVVMPMRI